MKANPALLVATVFCDSITIACSRLSFDQYAKVVEKAHELGEICRESADADEMTPQCEIFIIYYNNKYDEQIVLRSEEMSERGNQFINDIGYDEFDRVSELDIQV